MARKCGTRGPGQGPLLPLPKAGSDSSNNANIVSQKKWGHQTTDNKFRNILLIDWIFTGINNYLYCAFAVSFNVIWHRVTYSDQFECNHLKSTAVTNITFVSLHQIIIVTSLVYFCYFFPEYLCYRSILVNPPQFVFWKFGGLTKTGRLWGRVCIVFVSVQSKPICTTQHHITVVKRYWMILQKISACPVWIKFIYQFCQFTEH